MTAPLALVPCACGQPAAYVDRGGRPLCDRCNTGLNAPHPQAVRLPYPDWLVARRRSRLAALQAGDGLGEGPGLDVYDLNNLRWLNTLDVRNEEITRLGHARAFDAVTERALREERDVLRGALEESRGQVRTLRLTLDQGVGELVAMQAERDALREQAQRAEADLAALRAAVVKFASEAFGVSEECGCKHCKTYQAMLALLPPEAT